MHDSNSFKMKNILIVDDSQTNILFLHTMLEDAGYKNLYTALCANEAYEQLQKLHIDIILLDIVMPEIDGIEACAYIKSIKKHMPIIMVTSNDDNESLQKSFNAGANDFVTKPVNFINLNSRMKNIFSHQEKDMMILQQTRSNAMNEIIEMLAHQWRQPLASISSTALNIQVSSEMNNLEEKEIQESMHQISKLTKELSHTIKTISKISKTENTTSLQNINKLIRDTVAMIDKDYIDKNIIINIKESKLKDILIFPNELTRVLLNILINSQEAFIRKKKKDDKLIQISTVQDEKYTSIIIEDNAGGISSENIMKVFEAYFSTKSEKNAKGLGLYTSKQIIEQHQGGKIEISSIEQTTKIIIKLLTNEL